MHASLSVWYCYRFIIWSLQTESTRACWLDWLVLALRKALRYSHMPSISVSIIYYSKLKNTFKEYYYQVSQQNLAWQFYQYFRFITIYKFVTLISIIFSTNQKHFLYKADLQDLFLSGIYCHKTGTRPPSCNKPREPTMYVRAFLMIGHLKYKSNFILFLQACHLLTFST